MNYPHVLTQFAKMLKNLDGWLEKGAAHAKEKSWDAELLASSRLAPDQYPLVRQVQAACDAAKFAAAYLAGKEAPSHPDTEKTLPEMRERIHKCLAFLETIGEADLAGAEARKVAPKWLGGKWLRADDYLLQVAVPNFYFHVTTAYAILRHDGVTLGKADFIGAMPLQG